MRRLVFNLKNCEKSDEQKLNLKDFGGDVQYRVLWCDYM